VTIAQEIGGLAGLDEDAAAARLRAHGPNELPAAEHRGLVHLAVEVVSEPMILLLVGCGMLYLLLGDVHEAAILLGSVFVVIGITLYQNERTERALDALRDLSARAPS
jgi:Ca2+-transporting ATPase